MQLSYQQRWVERKIKELVDPWAIALLRLRFGVDRDWKPRTLDEVAEKLTISWEEARRMEQRILLRTPDRMPGL